MDRLKELQIFVAIAEEANLTRVAEIMGMSISGVSRALTSLESRLGVRLVQRTTRQLSLTYEGERFAQSSEEILHSLTAAEEEISHSAAEPAGTLRIGASLSFSLLHLMPVIQRFKRDHPLVRIELHASNRYHDLVECGLDLAIRTRQSEADRSVTMRKIADVPRLLAASPDYLARNGFPQTPQDLHQHKLLLYTLADDWNQLRLTRDGETQRLPVTGDFVSNDGQLIRNAALNDMGILLQPCYIIHDDLKAGRLVRVLPEWDAPGLVTSIAYPSRNFLPIRTRLFIDALISHFQACEFEQQWKPDGRC